MLEGVMTAIAVFCVAGAVVSAAKRVSAFRENARKLSIG